MLGFARRSVVVCSLLTSTVVFVGCHDSTPTASSRKATIASMDDMYDSVKKAGLQLTATDSDLDRALITTDLSAWFKDYTRSYDKLQGAADQSKHRYWDLRDQAQEYMVDWDKNIAETTDPAVKETMQQRKQRLSSAFDELIADAKDVSASYEPYIADLGNLDKALQMDLTPNGVLALKPSIEKAKKDGQAVIGKLDTLGKQLDRMRGRMTATSMPATMMTAPAK